MCPELSSWSFYPLTTYSSCCLLFNDSNHSNLKAVSYPRFLSLIPHILNISLSSSFDTPVPLRLVLSGCITAVTSGPLVTCVFWEQLCILTSCLSLHPCSCHSMYAVVSLKSLLGCLRYLLFDKFKMELFLPTLPVSLQVFLILGNTTTISVT